MRRALIAALVFASVLTLGAQAPPPAAPPEGPALTELETLRAENLKLKAQLLDLQRALAQAQLDAGTAALAAERTKLESAFAVSLGAHAGEVFNWQTLRFEAPPPASKP